MTDNNNRPSLHDRFFARIDAEGRPYDWIFCLIFSSLVALGWHLYNVYPEAQRDIGVALVLALFTPTVFCLSVGKGIPSLWHFARGKR